MVPERGGMSQVVAIRTERRAWERPLVLLLCLLTLWPGGTVPTVWAQELPSPDALRIQQMRVQVMPEFDDPRVLVMVQGRVSAVEGFPVKVTFCVPAGAQINQMATVNMESAGTTMAAYETQADPGESSRRQVMSSMPCRVPSLPTPVPA